MQKSLVRRMHRAHRNNTNVWMSLAEKVRMSWQEWNTASDTNEIDVLSSKRSSECLDMVGRDGNNVFIRFTANVFIGLEEMVRMTNWMRQIDGAIQRLVKDSTWMPFDWRIKDWGRLRRSMDRSVACLLHQKELWMSELSLYIHRMAKYLTRQAMLESGK